MVCGLYDSHAYGMIAGNAEWRLIRMRLGLMPSLQLGALVCGVHDPHAGTMIMKLTAPILIRLRMICRHCDSHVLTLITPATGLPIN
jgi:hypothetical protein